MVVAGMDGGDNSGDCAAADVTTLTRWYNGVLQGNDSETVGDGVSDGAECL